jgi:hypothetical protein
MGISWWRRRSGATTRIEEDGMSEPSTYESENRALAVSAFNLVKALMNALERKGLLEGGEVQAVLDETLTSLEHRHQDYATDMARRIIEATIMARAAQPRKGSE